MVQKFMVEKSGVEKSGVEMSFNRFKLKLFFDKIDEIITSFRYVYV